MKAVAMDIKAPRTYATRERAIKAVDKSLENAEGRATLRYIVIQQDGRWFPIFIGQNAIQFGIHFRFNVLA